jgi:hypothetical protein
MKAVCSISVDSPRDHAGGPAIGAGRRMKLLLGLPLVAAAACLTGCQVDVGGQTLPSAYYLQDDIQYFPAGPEFKLAKEAAAQKAYKKELAENNGRPPR